MPLCETCQTLGLELMHPVLDGARAISKHSRYFAARQALGNEKEPVETVIVTRFIRTPNLILKREDDIRSVGDEKWLHEWIVDHSARMRNYL